MEVNNYSCLEIWEDEGRHYKKVHVDEHEKCGVDMLITEKEFNRYKEIIEDEQ